MKQQEDDANTTRNATVSESADTSIMCALVMLVSLALITFQVDKHRQRSTRSNRLSSQNKMLRSLFFKSSWPNKSSQMKMIRAPSLEQPLKRLSRSKLTRLPCMSSSWLLRLSLEISNSSKLLVKKTRILRLRDLIFWF